MGGSHCCIVNCHNHSHDRHGKRINNTISFYCLPAWKQNEGGKVSEITRRRRMAWVSAVGRKNITFFNATASVKVCSRHFHSGKPAYEMLEFDPDWAPSLHLSHKEIQSTAEQSQTHPDLAPGEMDADSEPTPPVVGSAGGLERKRDSVGLASCELEEAAPTASPQEPGQPTNRRPRGGAEDGSLLKFLRESEAASQTRHEEILDQMRSSQETFQAMMSAILEKI